MLITQTVSLRELTAEERSAIEQLARSRTAAARLVERARILLATAQAWIPTEGKLVNNHWFDLREDPRISASSPLGRLGSAKTDRGVSHEVNRRIIDFAHDDQSSFIQEK
jgi:hypothetical protein